MKLLSNLKIPFVILWGGSIAGIISSTYLDNLQKIKDQKIKDQKIKDQKIKDQKIKDQKIKDQKIMKTKTDFDDPDFNPFRSY